MQRRHDQHRGRRAAAARGRGLTLVEMVVILAIVGLMATFGLPALQQGLVRTRTLGTTGQTQVLLQLAKAEAIRSNVPGVVRLDLAGGEIVAFADVHGVALTDPPDGLFNPIAGQPFRLTDWEVGRFRLPATVRFAAPTELPEDVVDGFTPVGGGEDVAILDPDGSVRDLGAFRFADNRDNYLEVRVAPQATARIQVRKWDETDSVWLARGEGGEPWYWN